MGVYPECGYFKSPDWQFVDVIAPSDLVAKSHDWQKLGANIFGGCCGIGPITSPLFQRSSNYENRFVPLRRRCF